MKKQIVIGLVLAIISCSAVNANTMQHWANVRDECGNLIGTVDAYTDVQAYGICEDNPARSYIYIPETGTYGTVASVYLYGGSNYEYENPLEYSYGTYVSENPLEYSYGTYPDTAYDGWTTPTYDEYYDTYYYDQFEVSMNEPLSYNTAPVDIHYGSVPEYGTEAYWEWFSINMQEDGSVPYYDETYNEWLPAQLIQQPDPPKYFGGDGEVWIDVDITSQTITAYLGGEVLVSGSCVTGNEGSYDTPVGTHYIMSKEAGAVLRGENPDGSLYECPVDYWMPFTESGCGIHDATWRDSFGGDIYKYSGSYGCVNTEYGVVSEIFSLADVGTRIEVHY